MGGSSAIWSHSAVGGEFPRGVSGKRREKSSATPTNGPWARRGSKRTKKAGTSGETSIVEGTGSAAAQSSGRPKMLPRRTDTAASKLPITGVRSRLQYTPKGQLGLGSTDPP